MIRKIVLSVSVAAFLNAFGLGDLTNMVSNSSAKKSQIETTQKSNRKCIPRMSGGSTSFTQLVTKKILTMVIEKALSKVTNAKNIHIPQPLKNTCEADDRLRYLQTITANFNKDIDSANRDILASVEQTKEIQALQGEITHKKKSLKEAEYNEGVIKDNEKLLKLIEKAKIKDKAKYSAAMGKLAIATPINGYMVVGWDKEILEFAKDNMVWGLQHLSALKAVASQLTTTIKVLPTLTSLVKSPLYNGKVDKKIAKRAAKQAIESDKKIAKEVESEFDS